MRTKKAVAVEPDNAATPTAVRRLLGEISTEDLEPLAVEVIREHRRRLQRAQELFETLERKDEERATAPELRQLRQDYRMAMLNLHGQHQLVSLVVAALGYVPDVDSQPPDDSTPH
jgi:DNA-binding transcriptional regulator YdaS (Cro superfamily)